MTAAQALLTELRALGADVFLDADGEPRVRARRGVLTAELRERLVEHKPDLIHLLRDEQSAIDWRVERMRSGLDRDGRVPATVAVVPPVGDRCETCGEPQAYGRVARCVLCALAAAQGVEERRSGHDRAPGQTEAAA